MSALPLFRRALADSWRGLVGWMLGLAAVVGMYLPLYPSIGGNPEFIAIIESLPPELVTALSYDQITTGSGYTLGTVHGLIGFVLVTIAAVGWGASAIAGDEERGTLELTLAHGVSRHQLVLERLAAIVVKLVALTAWVTLLVAVLNGPSELDISTEGILAGGVALLGTGLVTATIGLLAGALTGRRMIAIGAGAGIAVLGYALNALGNQNADLEWLHAISPYHWAYGTNPLESGFDASVGLLYAVAIIASAVAVLAFRRRDVGV
ncbi:MAG: ABC transporter permease subunit [Microcella pacifica]|uniref:ABC transporter permease subunit n=1 Tax=Microcella pacifica TaxID=2591847 RepID=A0A9E5JQR0_9MICO|nr:ABC transporter permease subunit [Microcella pacifica]MBR22633.1 ABC transporter permease [Leifsonia sp.]NHF63942.1 ABC transporter permease subunit [Microcella pacifica]